MKIKEEEMPKMSLYQLMKLTKEDCLDITGEDWDWGTAMCINLDSNDETDGYNNLMKLICMNIDVIKYQPDWYTITTIEDFMWDNKDVFEPWFNKNNRMGYRPKDYKHIDPKEDSGFYEAYMEPLESLICGNYSDSDYHDLYKKLIKKGIDAAEKTC